ncbi:MAG: PQQ-binding-like beta-propeller repeat protein, partial [Kiritimatiellae bacterium]|nr:PQQ-binding-like beta-propeller repeat protein [Kiritimatiellia bacterium]
VLGSPALWSGSEPPLLFLGSKFGDLIAINALSGEKCWHKMTGNWVDNNACCGLVNGRATVFVGSHDYSLYALDARSGELIWRRPLGAEVFSAPCLFEHRGKFFVAAACLDDRLYVVDAATGQIEACFRTGRPTWDKVPKGETLWGSPIAVTDGTNASVVLGSYDGYVYAFPMTGESRYRVTPRKTAGLWLSVLVIGMVLAGLLPLLARIPR